MMVTACEAFDGQRHRSGPDAGRPVEGILPKKQRERSQGDRNREARAPGAKPRGARRARVQRSAVPLPRPRVDDDVTPNRGPLRIPTQRNGTHGGMKTGNREGSLVRHKGRSSGKGVLAYEDSSSPTAENTKGVQRTPQGGPVKTSTRPEGLQLSAPVNGRERPVETLKSPRAPSHLLPCGCRAKLQATPPHESAGRIAAVEASVADTASVGMATANVPLHSR